MADLFPSLSTIVLPRLGQNPSISDGIRSWMIHGAYQASRSSNQSEVILENIYTDEIINYISFDYERFAFSSLESFCISSLESKSLQLAGWPLLKMYYSAFFAAHAIMRGLGRGVVKIEKKQSEAIEQILQVMTGSAQGFMPGMYLYRMYSDSTGRVKLSLKPHNEKGGVHESFWKSFVEFLEEVSESAVQNNFPDASTLLSGVAEISPMMKKDPRRGSVWFSSLRNEINYQHKHGVWFPLGKSKALNSEISNMSLSSSSSIRLDISREKSPISAFMSCSRYLSCLNWEIADFIAARSSSPKAFGSKWRNLKNKLNR
jgi:hypothetical protein